MSSCAHSQPVPPTTLSAPSSRPARARGSALEVDSLAVCGPVLARPLADGDPGASLPRDVGRLLEQLPDHLVAVRGDADALSRRHEVGDHLRADCALS